MESVLQSLRDIEGVLGSFLLDERGQLLARDMPSVFEPATLSHAGARLSQLRAALESGAAAAFDGCTARFGGHLLLLRAVRGRTLCVLCPVGANLNTLQMGLNLVVRRVVGEASSGVPAGSRATPPPPARHPPSPEESAKGPISPIRYFRGRPVP